MKPGMQLSGVMGKLFVMAISTITFRAKPAVPTEEQQGAAESGKPLDP